MLLHRPRGGALDTQTSVLDGSKNLTRDHPGQRRRRAVVLAFLRGRLGHLRGDDAADFRHFFAADRSPVIAARFARRAVARLQEAQAVRVQARRPGMAVRAGFGAVASEQRQRRGGRVQGCREDRLGSSDPGARRCDRHDCRRADY